MFYMDNTKGYFEVDNGRLYFIIENEKIDVTDECSDSSYYRHEITNPDGSKNVIYIGGTIKNADWIELIFDKDGNHAFTQMSVIDDGEGEWVSLAMHNESVLSGDPSLDDLLEK